MAAVWIRVLWLPVLTMFLTAVSLYALPRARVLAAVVCMAALTLSYSCLVRRVSNEKLGDVLHPRSQLWHTLFIGLGAYGDCGDIRWLDEYGYSVAAAAGISSHDSERYDAYLRQRFLDEISRHPLKYAAAIGHRVGDYVDEGRTSMAGARVLQRRSWFGWAFLSLAAICLARRGAVRVDEMTVTALYVLQIAVWGFFVPPLLPYAVETMGLANPLFAGVLVVCSGAIARRTSGSAWE